MKANKYFILEHLHRNPTHGGIGNVDIEKILLQLEFLPIEFPGREDFSFFSKIRRTVHLVSILTNIKAGSWVIFQFPLYARIHRLLIWALGIRKSVRLICLVADLDGMKSGDSKKLKKEIEILKRFKYLIVHNLAMKQWMREHHIQAEVEILEFFDCLATPYTGHRIKSGEIAFAGWLPKSKFLLQLGNLEPSNTRLQFHIYGQDPPALGSLNETVKYEGVVEPYLMPSIVKGSFGLVWDGDSIDEPGGPFGEYMSYISHHKLSLYILSGLPVIVPEWAGSAELVKKYSIGIVISSIRDIASEIDQLSSAQYEEMHKNCLLLAEQISKGGQLSGALARLIGN